MKRNILLNPGPATTTDTVKAAQVIPDICPREKEFGSIMKSISSDLVKIVHGNPDEYTSVLFCGSGTINIDICLNSLLPAGKKVLIVNNGSYSSRAAEVCEYYGLPFINMKIPFDERPKLSEIDRILSDNEDIAVVYTTHNETGTGLLNPIREIGSLAHIHNAIFVVDTTSTYAMLPIDIEKDNIDFCMASAQKGIMAMTGLSFIVGKTSEIIKSADYPHRSYYCNLYLQYSYFEKTGQMHFTPPVQTIYAARQGIKEYFDEGEQEKYLRHKRVFDAIRKEAAALGFREVIRPEWQAELVVALKYPDDVNWDFEKVHDYCYERGFTIYPGIIKGLDTFRLCSLGAIDTPDIDDFFVVFREALKYIGIENGVSYK